MLPARAAPRARQKLEHVLLEQKPYVTGRHIFAPIDVSLGENLFIMTARRFAWPDGPEMFKMTAEYSPNGTDWIELVSSTHPGRHVDKNGTELTQYVTKVLIPDTVLIGRKIRGHIDCAQTITAELRGETVLAILISGNSI